MGKSYHYFGANQILRKFLSTIFLLSSPFGLFAFIVALTISPADALLGLAWFLGTLFLGSLVFNMFPTVWVSENGLALSFFWRKIHIPWTEILAIESSVILGSGLKVIFCQKVTPLHWVYGLMYGRLNYPGFLVSSQIEDFNFLIREIKSHAGLSTELW